MLWGPGGLIRGWGAQDFAGGLVVHASSGISAYIVALMIGPRARTLLFSKHNQRYKTAKGEKGVIYAYGKEGCAQANARDRYVARPSTFEEGQHRFMDDIDVFVSISEDGNCVASATEAGSIPASTTMAVNATNTSSPVAMLADARKDTSIRSLSQSTRCSCFSRESNNDNNNMYEDKCGQKRTFSSQLKKEIKGERDTPSLPPRSDSSPELSRDPSIPSPTQVSDWISPSDGPSERSGSNLRQHIQHHYLYFLSKKEGDQGEVRKRGARRESVASGIEEKEEKDRRVEGKEPNAREETVRNRISSVECRGGGKRRKKWLVNASNRAHRDGRTKGRGESRMRGQVGNNEPDEQEEEGEGEEEEDRINRAFQILGTCLLWCGWIGFNGGSALFAGAQASKVIVLFFLV